MKISIDRQKTKKDLIRTAIFIAIVAFMFTLPLLFNYVGPWLSRPHENGPYLSYGSDASTNVVISYETPTNVSTTVYWGPNMTTFNIATTSNVALHVVNLTNLESNTVYYYKINSSEISAHYMNNFYYFKTAFNQTNPGAFRFAIYGDNQVGTFGTSEHQRIVNRIMTHNPDFVINTGDIVPTSAMPNWDRFFYEVRNIAPYKPYMISIGNHEQIEGNSPDYGKRWGELFNYPQENEYYYFNYSNVAFICLNISVDEHRITPSEQAWLISTLTTVNSSPYIDWIFIYFHIPMYSSGGHGVNQHVITDYEQIFKDYQIDIVFQGHDHQYERIFVNNINYFVNGGGGGALDLFMPWYASRTWSQVKLLCYHYLIIDIDGDHLHLQAIRSDGLVFDHLYLESKR